MTRGDEYDSVIVGAGPNRIAAAMTLAQKGYSVLVCEVKDTVGGGMRSAKVTLPCFFHDICPSIHPLALSSPFFRSLNLEQYGLEWIQPPIALAHPFDDGTTILVERSVESTAKQLGSDAKQYKKIMSRLINEWPN